MTPAKRSPASVEKGYLGEVAGTARAGIDRTVEYVEGVAEQTGDHVEDAIEQTREQLVELRKHGVASKACGPISSA